MTQLSPAGATTATAVGVLVGICLPIWSMVECAHDKTRPNRLKGLWIAFIALGVGIGPFIYALFASRSRYLKVGVGLSMTGVLLIVGMYFTVLGPATKIPEKETFVVTVEPPKTPPAKPAALKPNREVASPHRSPKGPRKGQPRHRRDARKGRSRQ